MAVALVVAIVLIPNSSRVRAYSSFADYVRPIQAGGGGGRLFTGTPADGYGCDVCHRGAQGAPLEVLGLPEEGYVPGQSYEITLRWPPTTPHVALMAELTDLRGLPAGTTALVSYGAWQEVEKCENGFPAADVCRLGGAGDGCCRDLDPMRDACSLPDGRSVLWMLDCGSKLARLTWTAPAAATGDVWFSTQMVTSDLQNDAVGDGVTALRRRIRPAGASPHVNAAVGDCAVARVEGAGPGRRTGLGFVASSMALLAWRRRSAAERARGRAGVRPSP
jgi:hypothetical protein